MKLKISRNGLEFLKTSRELAKDDTASIEDNINNPQQSRTEAFPFPTPGFKNSRKMSKIIPKPTELDSRQHRSPRVATQKFSMESQTLLNYPNTTWNIKSPNTRPAYSVHRRRSVLSGFSPSRLILGSKSLDEAEKALNSFSDFRKESMQFGANLKGEYVKKRFRSIQERALNKRAVSSKLLRVISGQKSGFFKKSNFDRKKRLEVVNQVINRTDGVNLAAITTINTRGSQILAKIPGISKNRKLVSKAKKRPSTPRGHQIGFQDRFTGFVGASEVDIQGLGHTSREFFFGRIKAQERPPKPLKDEIDCSQELLELNKLKNLHRGHLRRMENFEETSKKITKMVENRIVTRQGSLEDFQESMKRNRELYRSQEKDLNHTSDGRSDDRFVEFNDSLLGPGGGAGGSGGLRVPGMAKKGVKPINENSAVLAGIGHFRSRRKRGYADRSLKRFKDLRYSVWGKLSLRKTFLENKAKSGKERGKRSPKASIMSSRVSSTRRGVGIGQRSPEIPSIPSNFSQKGKTKND